MHDTAASDPAGTTWPRVTVVTVVLNAVQTIERTLKSVVDQDYPDLEYIVIDGGSTDGTIDVIRRYDGGITRWVSGSDGGPYAAMNRGAQMATGDWIVFMNGGDLFVDPGVIRRVFAVCDPAACDVIYGDGIICGEGYRAVERSADRATLTDGNGFSHQSSFVRTGLLKEFGFDTTEPVAADYDLFLRLRKAGKVFRRVDVVVSEFFLGGISTLDWRDTIRLRHRVYQKHFPRSDLVLRYRLSRHAAKLALRSVLPAGLWNAIKRIVQRRSVSPLSGSEGHP